VAFQGARHELGLLCPPQSRRLQIREQEHPRLHYRNVPSPSAIKTPDVSALTLNAFDAEVLGEDAGDALSRARTALRRLGTRRLGGRRARSGCVALQTDR
jgi:hypothetical protein